MERSPSPTSRSLEQRAAELLRRVDVATVGEIDDLLTDCAAEGLRLRTEELRTDRDLHDALSVEEGSKLNGHPSAHTLSSRGRRLAAEWKRLRELIEALRVERDRISRTESPPS